MHSRKQREGNELNINQYPPDTALIDTYLKQSEPKHCTHIKHEKCIFQQKKKGILPSEKPPKWRTGISTSLHNSPPHHQEYPCGHLQLPQAEKGWQRGDPLQSRHKTAILSFICSKQENSLAISVTLASLGRLSCSALCWYGLTSSHSFGQHNIRRIEKNKTTSKEGLQR